MGDDDDTRRIDDSVPEEFDASAARSYVDGRLAAVERLGRYRLLERVGRGAFGMVWAAYDPDLDRKVAIKFVLRGASGGGSGSASKGQRSLLSEAQLLAQLSNPYVVTIHDFGRLEQVQPELHMRGVFIVMEYLAGVTLREWLNPPTASERPSMPEILAVFLAAGRGLEAAHARGLAHLDFKPGNAMFGDDGRVRVLDFGLARVMRERAGDYKVAGTPAYMAPEQHLGRSPDARADQYAFCASLWHALYREPPFGVFDYQELAKRKLSTEPRPPREISLPPHIHAVLERGLALEPEQRFASISELLAALADDPIQRRRRRFVGAALLLTTLAAGFGLSQLSTRRADPCVLDPAAFVGIWDPPTRDAISASFARTQVSYAEPAFAELSAQLDARLERWTQVRQELCRAALVERSVSVERMGEQMLCLDRQLRRVAELSASLTDADAELIARAQASARELDDPARCRAVGDERGREPVAVTKRRELLLPIETELAAAEVAELLARYEQGLRAADAAIDAATSAEDTISLARAHAQRSRLLRQLGRHDEALAALHEALTVLASARAHAEARALEASVLVDAISLYEARGAFETAVAMAELARPHVATLDDPELAALRHRYAGTALFRLQRWDEALAELDAGIAATEDAFEPQHPSLAPLYIERATVLSESSRDPEQALLDYQRAIAVWTAAYGARHPVIGRALLNLAGVHFRSGDLQAALTPLEDALALFVEVYPPDHPHIGVARQNLGAIQFALGHYPAALPYFERSATALADKLGVEHPEYATAARNLGSVLVLLGRPSAARPHFEAAQTIYAKSLEPTDNRRLLLAAERAEVAWWLGDREAFERHVAQVEAQFEHAELNDGRRLSPASMLITAQLMRGALEEALARAEALVAFMVEHVGEAHVDTTRARVLLAEVLRAHARYDDARAQLEQSLDALQTDAGEHSSAWQVRLELAELELALERPAKAVTWLEPARDALEPGLLRAIVELSLARALGSEDPRARALLESAGPIIRARGPRPKLLEQLAQLEAVLGSQ